jgi:H+-transporting ATPase
MMYVTIGGRPKLINLVKGGWTTHKFTPFDPVSKRITAEVEKDGRRYTAAKGAPNAYENISFVIFSDI